MDELRAIWSTDSALDTNERAVLTVLFLQANNATGEARPSQARIAERTALGVRTVRRVVANLEAAGLVQRSTPRVEHGHYGVTTYRLAPGALRAAAVADGDPFTGGQSGRRREATDAARPAATAAADLPDPDLPLRSALPDQPLDPLRGPDPAFALAPVEPVPKATASPAAKRASRKAREVPYPDGFAPTPEDYAWALLAPRRLDRAQVDHELERFRDDALAKGKTYVLWRNAFRVWLGNARAFDRFGRIPEPAPEPMRPRPLSPERQAAADARAAEKRAGEAELLAKLQAEAAELGITVEELTRRRMPALLASIGGRR